MYEYLQILGLAHEVVKDDVEDPDDMVYQGPSPDEITMVETAADRGFTFIKYGENKSRVLVEQRLVNDIKRANSLESNHSSRR